MQSRSIVVSWGGARMAAAAALAVLAAGCRPAGPRVEIVSPRNGAIVGSSVLVTLRASPGLRVVPADGQRRAGEGHHHIFVDMDPPPRDSIIGTGRRIYHVGSGADTVTLTGLAPGSHRLIAVFAYGDHLPLAEVATDTVRIVVRLQP